MVKLVFCLRRQPGWSHEEFSRYWRDHHAPLVRRHAGALRVVRYVQLHSIEPALADALRHHRGAPEAFDGVAELWWESTEDFVEASRSEAGRRAVEELLDDERRFIDLGRSPLWMVEEVEVVPPGSSGG